MVDPQAPGPIPATEHAPPFAWRREAVAIAALVLVAALVRAPVVAHAIEVTHGDAGVVYLMMRRIASFHELPLLYYGQRYMGAIDPLMAAPMHRLLGARQETLALAQAIVFCAIALPLAYRLFHAIGGAVGARAGGLVLAVASPWFVACMTGRYTGYLSGLWIGALAVLAGVGAIHRAGGPRVRHYAAIGFLLGIGYYNNPQMVLFAFPIALAHWYKHGRIPELRGEGRLGAALGRRGAWVARAILGALAVACAGCVALCLYQGSAASAGSAAPFVVRMGGRVLVSFGNPAKYLPRVLALGGLVPLVLEAVLASDRRRWLVRAGAFVLGAAIGVAPLAVALRGGQGRDAVEGRSPPFELDPSRIPGRISELRFVRLVWLGDGEVEEASSPPAWYRQAEPPTAAWHEPARVAGVILRGAAIAVWASLFAGWLIARRRIAWSMVRLRPCSLSPLDVLVIQQVALVLLYLAHPLLPAGRYFVFGWLMHK